MLTARSARTIVTAGDPGANAASFARHLRAANLTPKTHRTYLDALAAFARFLTDAGIPTGGRDPPGARRGVHRRPAGALKTSLQRRESAAAAQA